MVTRLSREFGLTPASRVRLQAQPEEEEMGELDAALCADLPFDGDGVM